MVKSNWWENLIQPKEKQKVRNSHIQAKHVPGQSELKYPCPVCKWYNFLRFPVSTAERHICSNCGIDYYIDIM